MHDYYDAALEMLLGYIFPISNHEGYNFDRGYIIALNLDIFTSWYSTVKS